MKSWGRALTIALLILTLVVAVLITMAWFSLPLEGITVTVDGQTFSLADLRGPQVAIGLCITVAAVVMGWGWRPAPGGRGTGARAARRSARRAIARRRARRPR